MGLRLGRKDDLAARFPPVDRPFDADYGARRTALVCEALDRPELLACFRADRRLPGSYGVSFDERVVEYPWLFAAELRGRMLDAGSTLNHPELLDRLAPRIRSLAIATLAPEAAASTQHGISYVYADLRELPFEDGWFDTVACLSTLEHIGMDNAVYGVEESRAPDPDAELERAVAELRRVLAPGGLLLVTVPYGVAEDFGWFRQLDAAGIQRLARSLGADERDLTVFAYHRRGWQRSDLREAAGARYRDYRHDPAPAQDLAAAARAVACIQVRDRA
jgi:SAM-dependent methyltransferase